MKIHPHLCRTPINTTLSALIALALVVLPITGHAEEPNSGTPAEKPAQNGSPFGAFNMTAIYGQIIEGMLTQLAKPEVAAKLARFQRQHFEALVKEGFSPDEALKIVTSTQIPLMGASK
jgi:hypothetical protein